MDGRRVLVVGASAGVGRAVAAAAARAGATVVGAARRSFEIDRVMSVEADVTTDEGRARIVDACADGVDLVCFSAGRAEVGFARDTDAATWQAAFATNTIGANLLLAGLLPVLRRRAIVAVVSSETVVLPRAGMAAYAASKAALSASVSAWRIEHPAFRFSTVVLGNTQPTEFADHFDMRLVLRLLDEWIAEGLLQAEYMATTEVADVLVAMYASALDNQTVNVQEILLRPAAPTIRTIDDLPPQA